MLIAFGDESSDETQQRVFAVAAIHGTQVEWNELEVKWTARTGGIDFHAVDCDSDQGPYSNFTHEQNKALYRSLVRILAESQLMGFGVAVDLIRQNADLGKLLPESGYYKCFGEIVLTFAYQAYLSVPQEQVRFTFDRRLEIQYNATALYDYLAKLPEWEHSKHIHDEVAFASRKVVGIQAADLWGTRSHEASR